MELEIVKICKVCGPLTKDKVRFRNTRNEIICKKCDAERQKRRALANPDKIKLHRDKFRHIVRHASTSTLRCSKCKAVKKIENFNKHMFNIRYPYCRDCRVARTKLDHDNNKERHKKWYQSVYEPVATDARLKNYYGISLEDYEKMLLAQNGLCAICKKPETVSTTRKGSPKKIKNLSVDHDHKTGKVRGLLCHFCNFGIAHFDDNPNYLRLAIEYLEKHL